MAPPGRTERQRQRQRQVSVDSGANIGSKDFGGGNQDRPSPSSIPGTGSVTQSKGFQDFLSNTGRSDKNPYGDASPFAKLGKVMGFTPDYTNTMTPAQINATNMKAYQRYADFGSIDPIAQGRRFGSFFGDSVGEMTIDGPIAKVIPTSPMSPGEIGGRLGSMLGPFGPMVSFADRRGTRYLPSGSDEYAEAIDSGEFYDPVLQPEMRTGIFGNVANLLTGGAGTEVASQAGSMAKDMVNFFTQAPQGQQATGSANLVGSEFDSRAMPVQDIGLVQTNRGPVNAVKITKGDEEIIAEKETGNIIATNRRGDGSPSAGVSGSGAFSPEPEVMVTRNPDPRVSMAAGIDSAVNQAFAPMTVTMPERGMPTGVRLDERQDLLAAYQDAVSSVDDPLSILDAVNSAQTPQAQGIETVVPASVSSAMPLSLIDPAKSAAFLERNQGPIYDAGQVERDRFNRGMTNKGIVARPLAR